MVKKRLRSREWYEGANIDSFMHRSWMRNLGFPADMFDGRPVIGICNTWSELVSCNGHLVRLAEFVKRGVYEAGGLPIEFHVTPLPEANLRPSAMILRNLASMDVEETIRGNPFDGVVLLAGCDKTTPALLMGAASCDLPTILVSGGPMISGNVRGETPHIAVNEVVSKLGRIRKTAIDGRTTRHPGYAISQCIRKRVEEVFGWIKAQAGFAQLKVRGRPKAEAVFTFATAAYNLIRTPRLLAEGVQ